MKRKCANLILIALLCWSRVAIGQQSAEALTTASLPSTSQPLVASVKAVGITVSDIRRSVEFYRDVLTFEQISDESMARPEVDELYGKLRQVHMALGEEAIILTEYVEPKGRAIPADSRSNDHWFQHIAIITSDMDVAYERLVEQGAIGISSAPQRLPDSNPAAGGIRAYYFRDPDGHPLEILQFPADKGQSRWHRPTERVFLGIDHTAIVVANTAESLKFYRDLLGMKIVGNSMNFGVEQERLNNVAGARLRITSLRAESGPGVELLEYLSPSDGRRANKNTKANDLVHSQTIVTCTNVGQAIEQIIQSGASMLSMHPNGDSREPVEHHNRIVALDPDRHAIRLLAP